MAPAGAPPEQAAPISPEKLNLMEFPTWEEVANLLKNPVMRDFRLGVSGIEIAHFAAMVVRGCAPNP